MERIINHIINTMLVKGVIEEKQKSVIAYGLDLLLSTVISMTVLLVIGFILGQGVQTICFLIPLVLFQGFGGGYHCQTHLRCWAVMVCSLLFALLVLQNLSTGLLVLAAALSGYPILIIAPVRNPRAPFSEEFGRRMHRIVVWIYVGSLAAAGGIQVFIGDPRPVLPEVILSGISILGAYWHNAILANTIEEKM